MTKTVSLDNDVVTKIEQQAQEEERPFSQIVNRRLRDIFGLKPKKSAPRTKKGARAA